MSLRRYAILASGTAALWLVTQCKPIGDPANYPPPPPRHCETADECFAIWAAANAACEFDSSYPTANYYTAYNFHASRNIIAVVEVRVLHLSAGVPMPPFTYIPVRALAQPKGPYRGGPSGIDFNGPAIGLHCEYVKNTSYIDQYFYTPYRVCFEDDAQCLSQPVPAPSGNEIAMCDAECNKPNGMCTTADLPKSPALTSFVGQLIGGQLPINQGLQSVVGLLDTAPACTPGSMSIDANGLVVSTGSPCSVPLPLSDTAPWYAASLDVPSTMIGTLTRAAPPNLEADITWETGATMTADVYSTQTSPPISLPLWALRARPNELLFATHGPFCARVRFIPN